MTKRFWKKKSKNKDKEQVKGFPAGKQCLQPHIFQLATTITTAKS